MSNATLTTDTTPPLASTDAPAAAAPTHPASNADPAAAPPTIDGLALLRERIGLYRGTIAAIVAWLAIALFITAAIGFSMSGSRLNNEVNARVGWSVIWALVGIGLLGVALRLHPRTPAVMPWLADAPPVMGWGWRQIRGGVLLLGLLLLAGAIIVSTGLGDLTWPQQVGPVAQFVLWLSGLLLSAAGLAGGRWRLPRPHWGRIVIVAAVLVLALAVRVTGLGYHIERPFDEVHYTSAVEMFSYDNQRIDLLTSQSTFLPATMLHPFLNAATVEVFGWNWTGLRMVNALMGALAVLAVYGLGAALFNHRVGLIAALVAATFPPAVHFSRISMPHIGDALFGTLLILFIARGMRWNRPADWVLAGLSLGLTQYFFEGGRYSFPALTIGFFVWTALAAGGLALIRQLRPATAPFGRFRPYLSGWLLLLLMFIVTAAPVYVTMLATGAPFGSRLNASGIEPQWLINGLLNRLPNDGQMWFTLHITDPFLIYTFNPDRPGLWYSTYTPMVLYPFIPFFLLGVGHALWRGRTAAFMLVPLLLLASGGSILLSDTLWYVRYMLVMPTVALLIGLGIALTPPLLWGQLAGGVVTVRRWKQAAGLTGLAVAALVAAVQVSYYFGPFMTEYHNPPTPLSGYRSGVVAMQHFMTLDPARSRHLYIIDPNNPDIHLPRQMHSFLLARQPHRYAIEVADSPLPDTFFADLPRDRTYVFAVAPTDTETIAQMRAAFTVEGPYYTPSAHVRPEDLLILFVAPHTANLPTSFAPGTD